MDTNVYGQIPIFSHDQLKKLYAKAVKSELEDLNRIIEEGVMPFPTEDEMSEYDQSVEQGLNMAFGKIRDSDAAELPEFFMIDTKKRDAGGKGLVWVVAEGEVIDFTKTPVLSAEKLQ